MRNSHTHVVEGYPTSNPVRDANGHAPTVTGFGKSDRQALKDAMKQGGNGLFYFHVRSDARRVPVSNFPEELMAALGLSAKEAR